MCTFSQPFRTALWIHFRSFLLASNIHNTPCVLFVFALSAVGIAAAAAAARTKPTMCTYGYCVCRYWCVSSGADTLRSSHPSLCTYNIFSEPFIFHVSFLFTRFAFFRLCVVAALLVCVTNPTCTAGETILQHKHPARHPNKTPSLQLHIHSKHKQNRSWHERSASPTATRHVCACACLYASGMSAQHQFIWQLLRSLSLLILFDSKYDNKYCLAAPTHITHFFLFILVFPKWLSWHRLDKGLFVVVLRQAILVLLFGYDRGKETTLCLQLRRHTFFTTQSMPSSSEL